MSVVSAGQDPDVFVVFENGVAKRTQVSDYPVKGRATLGVRVAQMSDRGGDLVGALTVAEDDEVLVVMEKGKIVRSRVDEVRRTGRNTQGVIFATPDKDDAIVAVARNAERVVEELIEAGSDSAVGAVDGAAGGAAGDAETGAAVSATGDDEGDAQVDAVPSSETLGDPEQPDGGTQ